MNSGKEGRLARVDDSVLHLFLHPLQICTSMRRRNATRILATRDSTYSLCSLLSSVPFQGGQFQE